MNLQKLSNSGAQAQCHLTCFLVTEKPLTPSSSTLVLLGPFPLTLQEMVFFGSQLIENSG